MKTPEQVNDWLGRDLTILKVIVDSCFDMGNDHNQETKRKIATVDEIIFKYYKDNLEAEANKEKDGKDQNGFPAKITAPDSVVAEQSEKLFGFLCDSFLLSDPIFNVPSVPNQSRLSSAIASYITRNSNTQMWRTKLQKTIQDAVWYNEGVNEAYVENGNIKLKAIRPDKAIRDPSVNIEELLQDGSFYGYEDNISIVKASNILKAKATYLTNKGKKLNDNILKLFTQDWTLPTTQKTSTTKYGTKCTSTNMFEGELDFTAFMTEKEREDATPITSIQMRVLYKRLNPDWVGSETLKQTIVEGSSLPLYRIVTFNGIPVITQDVSDGSSQLIFCSIYLDSESEIPLSHAERLIPVQTYSAKLQDARMIGIRKLLQDSYVYDEQFVDIDGPIKKIKSNSRVDKTLGIDQFYRQDRKDYRELSTLLGSLGEVPEFADKISGNNPSVSGQHVVGNRTAAESQRLVMSAESRYNLRKLMLQQTLFEPLQRTIIQMCKINRTNIRYWDAEKEQLVAPTEEELSLIAYYLDIGDGGLPSSDVTSPESIQALMVMATQNQSITERYDAGDLFKQFALALGFKRIHDVRMPHAPNDEVGVNENVPIMPNNQIDNQGQPVQGQPVQGQPNQQIQGQTVQGQPTQGQ